MSALRPPNRKPPLRPETALVCRSRQALRRFLGDRSGNVVVLAGLIFPVMIGGMGLGTEVGYWYFNQRKLQHGADFAAYAAGVRHKAGDSHETLVKVATHVATESGFKPGTVTVNNPPKSGSYAGDSTAVEVILSESVPRAFTSLFDNEPLTLSGRAVVAVTDTNPACVLALSPDKPAAIDIGGNTNVSLSGCHIAANSTAANAFSQYGNAGLTVDCIHTVGGAVTTTKTNMTGCDDPDEGISPVADPYSDLEAPPLGACVTSGPGRYCGGMELKNKVTLDSGIYVIDGGTLQINANADVTGTGVTFYLTNGAKVQINGNAKLDLRAPTAEDDPYRGILFFGDRSDPNIELKVNGNSSAAYQGAIYIPAGDIQFSGNGAGANKCIQLIGNTVKFTGNSAFTADCVDAGVRTVDVAGGLRIVE